MTQETRETVSVERTGAEIRVRSPYSPRFVTRARAAGGAWKNPYWAFPAAAEEAVASALSDVYAYDEAEADLVTVRVMLLEEVAGDRGPAMLAGKVLANARGRDSGADQGADVIYESGHPQSGGSMKNWRSVAPEGAVVTLLGVGAEGLRRLKAARERGEIEYDILAASSAEKEAELERLEAAIRRMSGRAEALRAEIGAEAV